MIIRDLNFLVESEFKKVCVNIIEEKCISLIYIENKGYALLIEEDEDVSSIFIIKTEITPQEFSNDKHNEEKQDFIDLVHMFLDKIYENIEIPIYEKQHHEFVLLKLLALFENNNYEIIDAKSDLSRSIHDAFIKLDIDLLTLNQQKN